MKKIVYLICFFLCFSCVEKSSETTYGLIEYVNSEDNGLVQEVETEGFKYSVRYENPDVKLALDDISYNGGINPYEGKIYFTINVFVLDDSIKQKLYYDNGSNYSYNDYCRYYLDSAFYFSMKGKEYYPVDYTFIPGDYLLPYDTFLLVFEKIENLRNIKFVIDASSFGGEIINIRFRKRDIERIPQLKI